METSNRYFEQTNTYLTIRVGGKLNKIATPLLSLRICESRTVRISSGILFLTWSLKFRPVSGPDMVAKHGHFIITNLISTRWYPYTPSTKLVVVAYNLHRTLHPTLWLASPKHFNVCPCPLRRSTWLVFVFTGVPSSFTWHSHFNLITAASSPCSPPYSQFSWLQLPLVRLVQTSHLTGHSAIHLRPQYYTTFY